MEHLLQSDSGLTLLGTILGAIWTLFQSSDWVRRSRERRYWRAVQALEAGVELTLRSYVDEIKRARDDGKLTPEEAQEARRRAVDAAREFGRKEGLDVIREVGVEYLDLWLNKLVNGMKTR